MMRYETMKSSLLPAALLINDFVKGIGPYTYEQYLIEIVNTTPYFCSAPRGKPISTRRRKIMGNGIASLPGMPWTSSWLPVNRTCGL